MFRRVAYAALAAGLLSLGACAPMKSYSGFQAVESDPKDVQVGTDTKSTVQQGYVEKSNVNSVGEMSRMVEVMRSYTAIANLLQQQSDMHKSAIEKLADVPA